MPEWRVGPGLRVVAHQARRALDAASPATRLGPEVHLRQLGEQPVRLPVAARRPRQARHAPRRRRHRTLDVQRPLARPHRRPAGRAGVPRHRHLHPPQRRLHRRPAAAHIAHPFPAPGAGRRVPRPAVRPVVAVRLLHGAGRRRQRQLRRRVLRHSRLQDIPARLRRLALAFRALVGDSPCRHRGHPPFLGFKAPARIECPRWLLPAPRTAAAGWRQQSLTKDLSCTRELAAYGLVRRPVIRSCGQFRAGAPGEGSGIHLRSRAQDAAVRRIRLAVRWRRVVGVVGLVDPDIVVAGSTKGAARPG